jgi:hypothetical protein
MTILVSIPARTLQPGRYEIAQQSVPAGTQQLAATIIPTGWPNQTAAVMDAYLELSMDGGASWEPILRMTLSGGPFDADDLASGITSTYGFADPVPAGLLVRGWWEQYLRVRVAAQLAAV